jgi:alkanesulfonate monooxygenase SsuD/methylene tetrahydromethanopterin reductase-like flavin-dependent oxidoreductase (luciferase family)
MRFGLHSGQHQVRLEELADLWRRARDWGFDACYVFDHLVPLHSDVEAFLPEEARSPEGPCLEGFQALAWLARRVSGVGVGIMVASVGFRSPALLLHMAGTLAAAAPARLELGLGAGWFEPDYRMLGRRLPPPGERLDALARALAAADAWRRGAHAALAPPPAPVRLWVAGTGERRLIPLAARHADSWNAMYLTPEEYAAKAAVLAEACRRAGRDPASVERSIALRAFCHRDGGRARAALEDLARARGRDPARLAARSLVGTPEECAERLARYAAAGATHCAIMVHPPYDLAGLELLAAEVLPRFRQRTTAS